MGAEEQKRSAQKPMVSVIKQVLDCAIAVCSMYGIFLTSPTFCQPSPWHSQDGLKMGKPECCLKEFFQWGQQGFQPCAFCNRADLSSALVLWWFWINLKSQNCIYYDCLNRHVVGFYMVAAWNLIGTWSWRLFMKAVIFTVVFTLKGKQKQGST